MPAAQNEEISVDKKAYHLVTNKKLSLGQIIDFNNKENNALCNFFFGKSFINSNGNDYFDILKNSMNEEGLLINKDDSIVVAKYTNITIRAIRELITEYVRLSEFGMFPSRLSCLYCARTYDEVIKWKNIFESYDRKILQIVQVEYSGNCFIGDASKLPKENGNDFFKKMEEAREYWKGTDESVLPEMLVDGEILISKIIEEYE